MFLALQPSFASRDRADPAHVRRHRRRRRRSPSRARAWCCRAAFRVVAQGRPSSSSRVALGWCFGVGLVRRAPRHGRAAARLDVADLGVDGDGRADRRRDASRRRPTRTRWWRKVGNLRDFFVTLFFVGLGMSIPVPDGVDVLVARRGAGGRRGRAALRGVPAAALRHRPRSPQRARDARPSSRRSPSSASSSRTSALGSVTSSRGSSAR